MSCDAHGHCVQPSHTALRYKQTVGESQTVSQQAWDVLLACVLCWVAARHAHAMHQLLCHLNGSPQKTHTKLSAQKPQHYASRLRASHSNTLHSIQLPQRAPLHNTPLTSTRHQSHSPLSATPIPMQTSMQGRAVGSVLSRPGALGPSPAPGAQRRCSTDHVHTRADCCTRRPQHILLAGSSHCIPSFVVSPL